MINFVAIQYNVHMSYSIINILFDLHVLIHKKQVTPYQL